MRIAVPIKQVPETTGVRMDEETGTMVRDGVDAIINPLDLYALECALALAEHIPGAETSALTMGPPNAERALREAMAMGIDRGILVTGREFAGSDTWATSAALAAALTHTGPYELIICGERATDGDTGQVGPGTAAMLDLPVATYVGSVESLNDREITVRRLVESGYERLAVELPAVLTVVKEIAAPRLPTLRGKQRARRTELTVLGPDDLGFDPAALGLKGSPTRVVRIHRPKVARECTMVHARDPKAIQAACEQTIDFLTERNLI
jgi:electron transfer flavoprotein beta subunit